MKTIIRKPKGKIKVLFRHRNLTGHIFRPGEEYDYYATSEVNTCKCRGGKIIKMYHTKRGYIPKDKIEIIKQ